jgi:hypothetical protein
MRHVNMVGLAVLLVAIGGLDPGFANARPAFKPQEFGVGAQYGTTHVYVAAEDMDRFSASFLATFGGSSSSPADVTVTPTPSVARWQALKTPVGLVSLFGFKTPVPYPFGRERTGYLVTDMDAARSAVGRAVEALKDCLDEGWPREDLWREALDLTARWKAQLK